MKIGVDIDDVVTETFKHFVDFFNKKLGKSLHINNMETYDLGEFFEISPELSKKLGRSFNLEGHNHLVNFMEGSKESLLNLKKHHEIFFITSRPQIVKYMGIGPERIIFSKGYWGDKGDGCKSDICLENEINLMIEDSPHWALKCAEKGIKVLLLDKPWNQKVEHENIKRVYGWNEIVQEIKKLEGEQNAY
jgi:uncharacterized HAD superfamily protein